MSNSPTDEGEVPCCTSKQSSHSSEPPPPESISSIELLVREVPGSRISMSALLGAESRPPCRLLEDIDEVLEAMDALRDLAGDDEDLLEVESLYRWLLDFAWVHEGRRKREALTAEEGMNKGSDAGREEDAREQVSFAEEPDELLAKWLEDVFVLELAARILDQVFVGGADEVDGDENEANVLSPCPYCKGPVGEQTDQHVVKCKFANGEQEALDWMWRHRKEIGISVKEG